MLSIENLLAMGLPRGADPARAVLGFAGISVRCIDRIDWHDVATAVGALAPHERAALFLRSAPPGLIEAHELAALTLRLSALIATHDTAARTYADLRVKGKPLTANDVFARQATVVRTVLAEFCDPCTCRPCMGNGRALGKVEKVGKTSIELVTCETCHGSGRKAWSGNQRTRACGVTRAEWPKRYAPGYERLLAECYDTYLAAAQAVRTRLFGDRTRTIETRLQART